MKELRLGKGYTAQYSSFEELAKAYGCKPITKRTKDEKKLNKQREVFLSKHKCRACGEYMTYIPSSNVMTCTNEKCKGIKIKKSDSEGNTSVSYVIPFHLLDETGEEVATNILG